MSQHTLINKFRHLRLRILYKLMQWPRILVYKFLSKASFCGDPILNQPLQTVGLGSIEFLGRVNIGVFPSPYFFSTYAYIEARNSSVKISIGDGTWVNNNFCAIAEHTFIKIGRRVLIGTNVEIYDSDFHGIRIIDRNKSSPECARPVVIEDDVFLGSNVRILKGVTIGYGSVIANSSVVISDIPAGVIAGGIPARVLRKIEC
jgi:acetyltransferase-like isoleucine patch superfamily enzyme